MAQEHDSALYDFVKAQHTLKHLEETLTAAAAAATSSAVGTSTAAVGTLLNGMLPNIISKQFGADASSSEADGQMAEIERALRMTTHNAAQKWKKATTMAKVYGHGSKHRIGSAYGHASPPPPPKAKQVWLDGQGDQVLLDAFVEEEASGRRSSSARASKRYATEEKPLPGSMP